MVSAKSRRALQDEGFSLTVHKNYGDDYWAVNTKHPIYQNLEGDLRKILEYTSRMVSEGEEVPSDLLWVRAKDPETYGEFCYFPIFAYRRRDEWKTKASGQLYRVLSWDRMLHKEKNEKCGERRDEFRAKNVQFFRMYMMGDAKSSIMCPIQNINIDFQEFWGIPMNNCWQQHHFVFHNGTSLQKDGEDPGKNNCSTDLTVLNSKSRKVLEDTARTIFLSATAHDKIHKVKTSGDVLDYKIEQLPWALRSEQNWNDFRSFVIRFGHDFFPDYQTWWTSLILPKHHKTS